MAITVGRAALAEVNLIISQGADNHYSFRYSRDVDGETVPVDLTGYTARAQIRRSAGGELYLDMTDVTLSDDGVIGITIAAAVTEDPVWDTRSSGVWDLELVSPSGGVVRFASGGVSIVQDVTRAE